jgi:hypothetical protein
MTVYGRMEVWLHDDDGNNNNNNNGKWKKKQKRKEGKKKKGRTGTCMLIDVSIHRDGHVFKKEKILKY